MSDHLRADLETGRRVNRFLTVPWRYSRCRVTKQALFCAFEDFSCIPYMILYQHARNAQDVVAITKFGGYDPSPNKEFGNVRVSVAASSRFPWEVGGILPGYGERGTLVTKEEAIFNRRSQRAFLAGDPGALLPLGIAPKPSRRGAFTEQQGIWASS